MVEGNKENQKLLISFEFEPGKVEKGYTDRRLYINLSENKIEEKSKSISFTDDGMNKAEELLRTRNYIHGSLFDQENFDYIHYFNRYIFIFLQRLRS